MFPVLSENLSWKKKIPEPLELDRGLKQGHLTTLKKAGNPMKSISHTEAGARGSPAKPQSPAKSIRLQLKLKSPANEIVMSWIGNHHFFIDQVIHDSEKTSARQILQPDIVETLQTHEETCGLTAQTKMI